MWDFKMYAKDAFSLTLFISYHCKKKKLELKCQSPKLLTITMITTKPLKYSKIFIILCNETERASKKHSVPHKS